MSSRLRLLHDLEGVAARSAAVLEEARAGRAAPGSTLPQLSGGLYRDQVEAPRVSSFPHAYEKVSTRDLQDLVLS
jgi:hypothetical protein